MYQKGTYYFGIKIFCQVPSEIKKKLSHSVKQFRLVLGDFLHLKSYALDEYFNSIMV